MVQINTRWRRCNDHWTMSVVPKVGMTVATRSRLSIYEFRFSLAHVEKITVEICWNFPKLLAANTYEGHPTTKFVKSVNLNIKSLNTLKDTISNQILIFLNKKVPIFVDSWAHSAHLAGKNPVRNIFYEPWKIAIPIHMTNFHL